MEIKDLQNIINEKAEYKLNRDLLKIRKLLHDKDAFEDNTSFADLFAELNFSLSIDNNHIESLRGAFWSVNSFAFLKIKEALLPKYIKAESELFAKKVEDLEESIKDLLEKEITN